MKLYLITGLQGFLSFFSCLVCYYRWWQSISPSSCLFSLLNQWAENPNCWCFDFWESGVFLFGFVCFLCFFVCWEFFVWIMQIMLFLQFLGWSSLFIFLLWWKKISFLVTLNAFISNVHAMLPGRKVNSLLNCSRTLKKYS